jgi:hypothetical protein
LPLVNERPCDVTPEPLEPDDEEEQGGRQADAGVIKLFFLRHRQRPGSTKGGSITVPLTSCLTGLEWSVLQIKTKIVSCQTADFKPVKQEVNGTVILSPLVFPGRRKLMFVER